MMQGRQVLLAEDNLINQTVAKKVLTSLGMGCEVASDGQEAVEAVRRATQGPRMFDLVLMDMAMPVMGGVTATEVTTHSQQIICLWSKGMRTSTWMVVLPASAPSFVLV